MFMACLGKHTSAVSAWDYAEYLLGASKSYERTKIAKIVSESLIFPIWNNQEQLSFRSEIRSEIDFFYIWNYQEKENFRSEITNL